MRHGWARAVAGLAMAAAAGAASAQRTPLSAEDLYERIAPSVWLVETLDADGKGSLGSAVVIAPTELITNCHVVDKAKTIAVSHGGPRIQATLRHKDPERDLCQLGATGLAAPVVEIASESSLRVGSKLYAIGNPSGMTLTLSDGLLSGLRRDKSGKLQAVQTTVPISPGSSGGGLFDAYGRLVGIVTFFLKDAQNLNFALPATWIAELPRRAGGDLAVSTPAPASSDPELPKESLLAPPAPAAPRAFALVPGAVLEYRLRDRLTGKEQPVVYRLDRIDGERVVFNKGTRVELRGGDVVAMQTVIAGEFEQAAPPEGWVTGRTASLPGWERSYFAYGDGRPFKMEVQARQDGEQVLQLSGRSLRTVRFAFKGFTARAEGAVNSRPSAYRATAWYAPELGRVVRFEARTRGGHGGGVYVVDELLELVDARME